MEQKERKVIIFLAGELRNKERIAKLISEDTYDFYAADAGYKYAEKMGIPLKRILGDFDSAELPNADNVSIFPSEKDQTDSELALDLAIQEGYKTIWMLAPFGGRVDHTIANISLLEKAAVAGVDLRLYDGENLVFLLEKGTHSLSPQYQYISFFPIDKRATISLDHLKYPLKRKVVLRSVPLAISNQPIDKHPRITIHRGQILCICIEQEAI